MNATSTSLLQRLALSALELVLLPDDKQPWPLKLSLILIGYSSVVLPCWLLLYILRRKYAGEKAYVPLSFWGKQARAFAVGRPECQLPKRQDSSASADSVTTTSEESLLREAERKRIVRTICHFVHYFAGIQVTLMAMGFFQEKMMTKGYPRSAANETDAQQLDVFGDSQYLLLCNRVVAMAVAVIVILVGLKNQPPHVPAYYKHGYTSIANTISSWCQYEALKYVSFPTQMIFKCSKIVVTMIMGTLVRRTRYSLFEYVCGVMVASGASLFLVSSNNSEPGKATSVSGIVLMIGYIVIDAFTTNWQKKLFDTKPKVSKYQMMVGVNCFSIVLCFVSLLEQGTLFHSTRYALSHDGFLRDCFLLSISGALGQLYIYSTIAKFGPICFAVIMTIRQIASIVLSSIYYNHPLDVFGIIGLVVVFGAMFADIYRRYHERQRAQRAKRSSSASSETTSTPVSESPPPSPEPAAPRPALH